MLAEILAEYRHFLFVSITGAVDRFLLNCPYLLHVMTMEQSRTDSRESRGQLAPAKNRWLQIHP
jgi:hypothetical protein